MKRLAAILAVLGLFAAAALSLVPDETPPSAIGAITCDAPIGSVYRLHFTAPGDDGAQGRATRYEAQYLTAYFKVNADPRAAFKLPRGGWASIPDEELAAPSEAGSRETLEISLPWRQERPADAEHRYRGPEYYESWWRIRAVDEAGNAGPWSPTRREFDLIEPSCRDNEAKCHQTPPRSGQHGKHVGHMIKCHTCHQCSVNEYYETFGVWHDNGQIDVDFADLRDTGYSGLVCTATCHKTETWPDAGGIIQRLLAPRNAAPKKTVVVHGPDDEGTPPAAPSPQAPAPANSDEEEF